MDASASRTALALSGGGARGAWQAGVIAALMDEYPQAFGILTGASVGAVHAAHLAAHAARRDGIGRLLDGWRSFRLDEVVRPALLGSLRAFFAVAGFARPSLDGVLDGSALDERIASGIPFDEITRNIGHRRVAALAVSATRIATGRCVVFVQRAEPGVPRWSGDPGVEVVRAQIGLDHVRASSAIPFLLPPVPIDGALYCDGGLRQNVPLSPALYLGARRLVVVTTQSAASRDVRGAKTRQEHFGGPVFLLGKTMNAILDERVDEDLRRMERINEIVEAGARRYGPGFVDSLELPTGHDLRAIDALPIRPSESLGALAAEHVRSNAFSRRVRGVLGLAFRRLVESEGDEADLVSYLLFDGAFAARLIELGREDALARRASIAELLGGSPDDATAHA